MTFIVPAVFTFMIVFIAHMLSFFQYEQHKLGQISHTEFSSFLFCSHFHFPAAPF